MGNVWCGLLSADLADGSPIPGVGNGPERPEGLLPAGVGAISGIAPIIPQQVTALPGTNHLASLLALTAFTAMIAAMAATVWSPSIVMESWTIDPWLDILPVLLIVDEAGESHEF